MGTVGLSFQELTVAVALVVGASYKLTSMDPIQSTRNVRHFIAASLELL